MASKNPRGARFRSNDLPSAVGTSATQLFGYWVTPCMFHFLKIHVFTENVECQRTREGENDFLLDHSQNVCSNQGWAGRKPGAGNSTRVSDAGARIRALGHPLLPPWLFSRKGNEGAGTPFESQASQPALSRFPSPYFNSKLPQILFGIRQSI